MLEFWSEILPKIKQPYPIFLTSAITLYGLLCSVIKDFSGIHHRLFTTMTDPGVIRLGQQVSLFKKWLQRSLMIFQKSFKRDRKSTRLNSSHVSISYAVFCLQKNNK